jgi:Lipocalin-like domain
MIWRSIVSISAIAALGLFAFTAGHGQEGQPKQKGGQEKGQGQPKQAQPAAPPKPWKEAIVGSWSLLISDVVNKDGTQTPQFGPNPMGLLMFDAGGHFSMQIMRASRPKFAAKNRLQGTADENKAAVAGTITQFGGYTLDEPSKTLTFRVEASSYPNDDGLVLKRTVTALNPDDVLTYNQEAGGDVVMRAWKYMK